MTTPTEAFRGMAGVPERKGAGMKERPILFSGPMVRAILDGTKTQTRRIVKPQPQFMQLQGAAHFLLPKQRAWESLGLNNWHRWVQALCPYGQPGDRLWVRESYFQFGHWEPVDGKRTKGGRQKWAFIPDRSEIVFCEPGHTNVRKGRHHKDPATPAWHKRLGRFMPRAASRITLEITGVRVERLQDISGPDCWAEGIANAGWCPEKYGSVTECYRTLWESINGPGSWAANPYVWAITFRRL